MDMLIGLLVIVISIIIIIFSIYWIVLLVKLVRRGIKALDIYISKNAKNDTYSMDKNV